MKDLDSPQVPELSLEQLALVSKLTVEDIFEIEEAILSVVDDHYRKVAFIVGSIMLYFDDRFNGIPDAFYYQLINRLIENGDLTARGSLGHIQECEVKIT